jgi:hypothetical protein
VVISTASTNPTPAGGQRDGGGQASEGERGQHLRPAHLVVAAADVAQGHHSTRYSDRWLTSDVTVIDRQRLSTRSRARAWNLTVASSQPDTGDRRISRSA